MSNSFSRFLLFPFDFIDELFRSCVAGVPDALLVEMPVASSLRRFPRCLCMMGHQQHDSRIARFHDFCCVFGLAGAPTSVWEQKVVANSKKV